MGTTKYRKKFSSSAPKEDNIGRPKGSMLERSFQELEKSVAELCPTMMNTQDKDQSSQGAKRRLPAVVKQKLAKVAILAMNQGKISNNLIDRLMNIVGHTIQLNILKRSFKQMIELGKSAKERKDKLHDIRREDVNERSSAITVQEILFKTEISYTFQTVQILEKKRKIVQFCIYSSEQDVSII